MAAASLHDDVFPNSNECLRWWEGLRAQEVTRCQQRHRVSWDATDGRNGRSERTVRNAAQDGKIRLPCNRERPKSDGFGKAFQRVSLPAKPFNIPKKRFCVCHVGISSIKIVCSSKGALRSRSTPPRPFFLIRSGAVCGVVTKVSTPAPLAQVFWGRHCSLHGKSKQESKTKLWSRSKRCRRELLEVVDHRRREKRKSLRWLRRAASWWISFRHAIWKRGSGSGDKRRKRTWRRLAC